MLHTWPLASAPGTLSRNDNGDYVLHEWIMAWVAHQLVTDPWHLFDANIFFPERHTLAYSDHLFVQSLFGAPLLWAGASPVLAHNLVLIAGFALSGWTSSLVVSRWTGSRGAGLVSGSLVAFNAFSLTRLPQIQDLHVEFFPLALYALDQLLASPQRRHALRLALWFVLQSLTGTYLMVFTSLSLVWAALSRPAEWTGVAGARALKWLAAAAALAIAALLPFLLPYHAASASVGLGRSLDETTRYSAVLTDYLAAPGRLYFEWWGKRFFDGDALFPGLAALALAGVGVWSAGWRDRRARMLLVVALFAFAFSFGPAFAPYRWLYSVFPLMSGIRGAVRLGQVTLMALGLLAGFGVARLQQSRSPRVATVVALAALLVTNGEALRAPLYYSSFSGIPPIYNELSRAGRGAVIAAFPFYASPQFHLNTSLMLANTRTFQPMLNGYSGFKPASYYANVEALAGFPDERSIARLQDIGVSIVIVDSRNMRPQNLARLDTVPQLSPWATDGNLRYFLLARSR